MIRIIVLAIVFLVSACGEEDKETPAPASSHRVIEALPPIIESTGFGPFLHWQPPDAIAEQLRALEKIWRLELSIAREAAGDHSEEEESSTSQAALRLADDMLDLLDDLESIGVAVSAKPGMRKARQECSIAMTQGGRRQRQGRKCLATAVTEAANAVGLTAKEQSRLTPSRRPEIECALAIARVEIDLHHHAVATERQLGHAMELGIWSKAKAKELARLIRQEIESHRNDPEVELDRIEEYLWETIDETNNQMLKSFQGKLARAKGRRAQQRVLEKLDKELSYGVWDDRPNRSVEIAVIERVLPLAQQAAERWSAGDLAGALQQVIAAEQELQRPVARESIDRVMALCSVDRFAATEGTKRKDR